MTLLGEIVEHEGCLRLQTAPNCWYPLNGASGIGYDFRQAFGRPMPHDVGKRVYRVRGVLQMENDEQRLARVAPHNPDINPKWTPKMGYRVYACSECGTETKITTNHTGTCFSACAGTCRDIFNPHTAREQVLWHPHRLHKFIREA